MGNLKFGALKGLSELTLVGSLYGNCVLNVYVLEFLVESMIETLNYDIIYAYSNKFGEKKLHIEYIFSSH